LLGILRDHGFEAWLMDNALRDVRHLGTATSGYLYACRRSPHVPSSRVGRTAADDLPAGTAR
nr:hypothetical protein [Micromonospora sp. DSM 115978]